MVAELPRPTRPVTGGRSWTWDWRAPTARSPWGWCRIYHVSEHTQDAVTHRQYGPLHRLDPQLPDETGQPQACPDGRSALYVAGNLLTALGEVLGDHPVASVCPNFRVALVRPSQPIDVLDLRGQGTAMGIGSLPSLATGAYPRHRTQEWARAIYEDQPARRPVRGVYYSSAHAAGPALALWGTDGDVEVLTDADGREQDFPLVDPRLWARVVTHAVTLGLHAETVDNCANCRPDT